MPPSPSRIVLLHGFTQTSASWRPVVDRLDPELDVVAPDLPGHGRSGLVEADLAGAADLVAAAIGGEPALVVGYSMGARTALRLALDHPLAVGRLIVVGATAGIDDPEERQARKRADEVLADRILRDGVEAFLEDWLTLPLFDGLVPAPDDLAARQANTAQGLASSLRLAGTATMDPPWWDELHRIQVPTLVVWGERDRKFAVLGVRLAAAIGPNAEVLEVPAAGHAAHLANPDAMARLVQAWARTPAAPTAPP